MSFQLTGTIHEVGPVISRQVNDKTYKSQDIILSCPENINGTMRDNYPKLTGKTEKVLQYMSGLKEGQQVTLHFNVKGFNGSKGNFTGLEIWKVDAGQQTQQQAQPSTYRSEVPQNFNPSPSTADDSSLPF